ncbi:Arginine kinase [Cyphomyrmex costatus]|uniref:Arginine kinase n=1 Tax=Cyphomyrmex costatus TaxID=456900 RepID=A0A195CVQ4_9HYME|nr:Arginine kinase [Cyphomyrmex costatus]
MHSAVRNWLNRGELERLENVVLEGRGTRLLGEQSQDLKTRVFLKGLPNYLTKISQVHDAVARGSLADTQKIIFEEPKKKLAIAKDSCGVPLLHKAVYYDQPEIIFWLIENYPITPQQKDREGRTALHYCCVCKDPEPIWDNLIEGGCDASICDKKGHPASYYLEHPEEIELPEVEMTTRRRKSTAKDNMDFKPSNIRIWIHNKDIGKLQQVLWEGHGSKLRCETSNNSRIRRFLEAVPFIMGTIKDIHATVINNDLEGLKTKLEEPILPIILCGKDGNGLNALHKAAGLGYIDIAREILERCPSTVMAQDNEGKTPLHYAAALKDDGVMYDLLTEHGADESKLDNRQKAPAFYKNRPSDVDLSNLSMIPEAPRVSDTYPKSWDWRILEGAIIRGMKKVNSDDSAFGSAESTMKDSDEKKGDDEQENEEAETPNGDEEAENPNGEVEAQNEEEQEAENGEEEEAENGEEEEAQNEDEANDAGDENEAAEDNEEDATNENDEEQEEKASSDDDVVTGLVAEPTKDEEDGPEAVDNEDGIYEESPKIEEIAANDETIIEHEERNEPSTGDSGVDDPAQDEEQVIVGEHQEPAEVELTEGSMGRDLEVDSLLENDDMEQLATLVLNGEGRRLVGRQCGNPELQAFIDNVPTYMGKIRTVHMAAREGNLRDLQSALDRRKFAVARDESSPHGATPLHVAVIFGNTVIIRYLAGRFPETTNAIDLDGRTPLHYAATIADNGHYYNLLLHLGSNPLIKDNFGQKADYYKRSQSDLSHKKLLRSFGASETLADEMLTDKARRDVSEPEVLATLERCFRLLAGNRRSSIPKTPSSNAGTLVARCLKRPVFDLIKHRVTRMDHNLFDVIWPSLKRYGTVTGNGSKTSSARSNISSVADEDHGYGVVAPDFESYVVFTEFFDPFIRELHCVTASGDLPDHSLPRFFSENEEGEEGPPDETIVTAIEQYDLDPTTKYIQAGILECTRNLVNYCLPLTLTVNQLEEVEREITNQLMSPEITDLMAEGSSEDEAGTYFTLNEILEQPSQIRAQLAAAGLLLPITEYEPNDERRLHGKHWPYGRGVYVTTAGDLAVWVNIQDHLRIICRTNENRPGLLGRAYVRVAKLMMIFDRRLKFKRDQKLGFLSARPHTLGNTIRFCLIIRFPELSKTSDNLRHLCVVRGLNVRDTVKNDMVRIGNQQSLAITELQTLQDFSRAVHNIITLEKELSLNNSMKIANLITDDSGIDIPIFHTEEGHYLASCKYYALGDPLIKGLTEVANARPKDPITYLATYLYNFASKNKVNEQESDVFIMPDHEEENLDNNIENDVFDDDAGYPQSPNSDIPESTFSNPNRDEHGQSMIHFAAVRSYSKDGLYHLLLESQVNVGFRDELYRTARDVAEQANIQENIEEIDRFIIYLAARGETEKLVELLLEGYDHILDAEDEGANIIEVAAQRSHEATVQFLQSIPNYVNQREEVHAAVRANDEKRVKELLSKSNGGGKLLAVGKNSISRCALHIAVLQENEELVKFIATTYPETLRIGDNLERTALHYAMGVTSVEVLSNILIKAGAKRIVKDLKSRQPSYYFMNKSDIERLQEEEKSILA